MIPKFLQFFKHCSPKIRFVNPCCFSVMMPPPSNYSVLFMTSWSCFSSGPMLLLVWTSSSLEELRLWWTTLILLLRWEIRNFFSLVQGISLILSLKIGLEHFSSLCVMHGGQRPKCLISVSVWSWDVRKVLLNLVLYWQVDVTDRIMCLGEEGICNRAGPISGLQQFKVFI